MYVYMAEAIEMANKLMKVEFLYQSLLQKWKGLCDLRLTRLTSGRKLRLHCIQCVWPLGECSDMPEGTVYNVRIGRDSAEGS